MPYYHSSYVFRPICMGPILPDVHKNSRGSPLCLRSLVVQCLITDFAPVASPLASHVFFFFLDSLQIFLSNIPAGHNSFIILDV